MNMTINDLLKTIGKQQMFIEALQAQLKEARSHARTEPNETGSPLPNYQQATPTQGGEA